VIPVNSITLMVLKTMFHLAAQTLIIQDLCHIRAIRTSILLLHSTILFTITVRLIYRTTKQYVIHRYRTQAPQLCLHAVNILFVVAFPIFMDLVDSLKQQNSELN
jgi:hypothetical protein